MFGLIVILFMTLSGHSWIVNKIKGIGPTFDPCSKQFGPAKNNVAAPIK